MVAQLAARSCGDFEVTGSNPTIRWETFGLNPQTRSSRISRFPPKVGPDQPVVYTKKNRRNFKSKVICFDLLPMSYDLLGSGEYDLQSYLSKDRNTCLERS